MSKRTEIGFFSSHYSTPCLLLLWIRSCNCYNWGKFPIMNNTETLSLIPRLRPSPPPLLPSLVSVSFLTFVSLIAIITMKIETTIDEKNKGRIHLSFYWFSFFSFERSWFRHKNYSLFQTLNLFVGDPRFRNASWYWLLNNNSNLKLKILV